MLRDLRNQILRRGIKYSYYIKRYYNAKRSKGPDLKEGDKV